MKQGDVSFTYNGCTWLFEANFLLVQTPPGTLLLDYQMQILGSRRPSALLMPQIFHADQTLLLLYDLEGKTAVSESAVDNHFTPLSEILFHFCKLRDEIQDGLLDHQRLVSDERLIFTQARQAIPESDMMFYFIYLPIIRPEEESSFTEAQLEALSLLTEKAAIQAVKAEWLTAVDVAEWIKSSYSDYQRYREICMKIHEQAQAAKSQSSDSFKLQSKKTKAKSGKERNKDAILILACLILSLLLANLIMNWPFAATSAWQRPSALFFLCIAIVTSVFALVHKRSPFYLEALRFQKEQEATLTHLMSHHQSQRSTAVQEAEEEQSRQFYPAYLLAVPATQGQRLRTEAELRVADVELFIFSDPLTLGADPQKAAHSFAYKNEAACHSRIFSDETGAWLESLDESGDIFINQESCVPGQAYLLPDHCLIRFGPVLKEFVRESR